MGRLERWHFGVWSLPRLTARTTHKFPFLRIHIDPLESQFLRTNAADRNQRDGLADRILQTLDQPVELIARWKLLSLLDRFRRKVGATRRIGRDVSVFDRGNEDRAEPPLKFLMV
jgi:hypothetical protein